MTEDASTLFTCYTLFIWCFCTLYLEHYQFCVSMLDFWYMNKQGLCQKILS